MIPPTAAFKEAVLPIIRGMGKSKLQVPDTGKRVLDNTKPFLHSSIVSFWITPARSKECKYHIFRQYWYTKNVPVFTNTGMFQYLGPEVYFFGGMYPHQATIFSKFYQSMYIVYPKFLQFVDVVAGGQVIFFST